MAAGICQLIFHLHSQYNDAMRIAIQIAIAAVSLTIPALSFSPNARAQGPMWIEGKPNIVDGDTIRFSGYDKSLRLLGIDAPELAQPGGVIAKATLERMAENTIRCEWVDVGRYGRPLATCYAMTRSGKWSRRSINSRMVRSGVAWSSVPYGDDYEREMLLAMKYCTSLWEHAPWCFRRKKK